MKRTLTRGRQYVQLHWQLIVFVALGAATISVLLLVRLGSLTGSVSLSEIQQAQFASSWRHIADNPLQLPYTFVQWVILTLIPHHGDTVTRAASPVFGVLALAAFAYTLRRWYGIRSALYGTTIFAFCSWFLHVSRYAGTDVVYLWAVPMLLAVVIAWERHHLLQRSAYLALTALAVLMYIPGMQWLVLAALLLQPHLLLQAWRSSKDILGRSVLALLPIVLLAPLALAFTHTPELAQTWLGFPVQFGTPGSVARSLLHSISFFVYRGPINPELWLARAPILSFFTTVMAVLGALFYAKHYRAPRTRLLFAFFLIGALLFALGGPVTISILVPLVYLLVAAGFGYLLHEWLRVFPRNPLARGIGFSLLAIVVALTCFYDLKAYFVAWPHNPATQAAFHKHL